MPRAKKVEPLPEQELQQLQELIDEQTPGAEARAFADSRRISASYIAKGDHLVLLIVRTDGSQPKRRLYSCRILDVKDSL